MSARPRSVAVVQLRAHERADFTERWPSICTQVDAAAGAGAELIVVPEGTVPAYVLGAEPVDAALLERAAEDLTAIARARGCTIVYGTGRYADGRYYNSAAVVTPEGTVGHADKYFLWHFDRRWYAAGERLEPVTTPVGRLGVLVCADGRIPTIAATLVDRGAEILVVPTAWVSSGRDPANLENVQADLMINVRAFENGVPLVAANKVGVEARCVAYCGKSAIVAADGSFVARAGQDEPTRLTGSVAIGPPFLRRPGAPPAVERGALGEKLPATLRIALAARHDDALHALSAHGDATLMLDPRAVDFSHEIAIAQDEAVLDPRALVGPRLAGVRIFVWHASIAARWVTALARTRAAELRAYVVVLDTLGRRAFAVDPDGTILSGTFGACEVAAFTFVRTRTEAWEVAPHTNVRTALERVARLTSGEVAR